MTELLTRETARERTHEARLAGTLIDFALILQAEALEVAAEEYVLPAAVILDDPGLTQGTHTSEAAFVLVAVKRMKAEAARLRKEAQ